MSDPTSTARCTCPPFVDGGVLVRTGCPYPHPKPGPKRGAETAPTRDPLVDEIACAWSDYRSAFGASGSQQHKAFVAGFQAARGTEHNGVTR